MAQVFKTPIAQAEELSKVPEFNKDQAVAYYKNYGDGFYDDAYDEWLKEKKRPAAARKPLNPEFAKTDYAKQNYFDGTTNFDQWLADEEWLRELWNEDYPDIKEYAYSNVDDDYTRSYGPVDSDEKYASYLKWLAANK